MGSKPLTARQQYWFDHLKAAAASDGTLVDYAKKHQLTPKHLYLSVITIIESLFFTVFNGEPASISG